MSITFGNNIDLAGLQLLNARIHVLASDPGSPVSGQIWYNSTSNTLKYYNGSGVQTLGVAGVGGDADTLDGHDSTYFQVGDATLTALAAFNTNGLLTQTAADTFTGRTLTAGSGKIAVTNGSGVAGNPTVDLGTVTTTDVGEGTNLYYTDVRVRANRLDQLAAPTASVSLNSQKITNLLDPTSAQDAASKAYVDATSAGRDWKDNVRAATTANITLSGTQTIDGVAVIAGDRVLVKDQSTGANNGIYVVAAGAWSRSTDADTAAELNAGATVSVAEGTVNGDKRYLLTTNDPITLGTTALTWTLDAGEVTVAGTGITKTGTTLAIDTASGYGVRKYATDIGDGSATSFVVTHSLSTRDVQVQVRANATPWAYLFPDVEATSTTTVTIRFGGTAPTASQYRVIVTG